MLCLIVLNNFQLSVEMFPLFQWFPLVIGPKNSRHSLNQSDANVTSITIWSPAFSRALDSLVA